MSWSYVDENWRDKLTFDEDGMITNSTAQLKRITAIHKD